MSNAKLTAAAVENASFTTSGSLIDLVDKKVLIVLRDNRKIQGVLRSYDQYANLVLQKAVERFFHAPYYADVERGIYLVRGENVVMMGEVDLELEDLPIPGFEKVTNVSAITELMRLVKQEEEQKMKVRTIKEDLLMERQGFSREHAEGDTF